MWLCGGNLEVPLTALADFFPVDEKAFIQVANEEDGAVKDVPFYAGLRWARRKLARAVAGSDGVEPPAFGELELPTYDEMCEDLAYFGCPPTSARPGDVQHFGAYILDMLYTIYSAQRGTLRTTSLFGQCPNCRARLWDRPESWSHISNDQKVFNIPETWVWAAILLPVGKLRKVSHLAWVCVLTFEAEQGPQSLEALPTPSPPSTWKSAHPRLQQMLRAHTPGAATLEGTRHPVQPIPERAQG
eukprot:856623-Amphidinium_carterae.1